MSNGEEKTEQRKRLEFTCPRCGGHRLEQVIMIRNVIDNVYDSCDPDYDWYNDYNENIVLGDWFYSISPWSEHNFYRCVDCDSPLLDEDGHEFWENALLIEWLKANCQQEDS